MSLDVKKREIRCLHLSPIEPSVTYGASTQFIHNPLFNNNKSCEIAAGQVEWHPGSVMRFSGLW